jgi:phage terminase large subunit GpA-like protein
MFGENPRYLKHPEKEIDKYRWEPTKKPDDSAWRSYRLNAMYSPIGMLTFTDVAKARAKAEAGDHVDMRSYVNIYMGMPYKDTGQRPKIEKVIELRGDYKSGTVPKDVLFLTMAVDVQRGSEKDEKNPPRLELEVLGVGRNYRTWSILYKQFLGPTDDPFSGAWEELGRWAAETDLAFTRMDGVSLKVQIIGIDSGDQPETVYRFCETFGNHVFPIKGFGNPAMKTRKDEKGDLPYGFRRYRPAKLDNSDKRVLEINTWYYKTLIYGNLKIERKTTGSQDKGFCSFPRDYPDEYFAMLTGEEKRMDGSFHPIRERVEALDCRVYNLALADFYLETQLQYWKAYYQQIGMSAVDLLKKDTLWLLSWIEAYPNKSYLVS